MASTDETASARYSNSQVQLPNRAIFYAVEQKPVKGATYWEVEETKSCEKLWSTHTHPQQRQASRQQLCPYQPVVTHLRGYTNEKILIFQSRQNLGLA